MLQLCLLGVVVAESAPARIHAPAASHLCGQGTPQSAAFPQQPYAAAAPAHLLHPRSCHHPAGAYGCTISGAGPTAIAVVDDPNKGAAVGEAMAKAFEAAGLGVNTINVVRLDEEGARLV